MTSAGVNPAGGVTTDMLSATPLFFPDAFHVQAAIGWLELSSPADARAELENISGARREHPDALEVWWNIFAAEKNWPGALTCAERLLAAAPERASGWLDQSFALHELKRTREAFERLSGAAQKFPGHHVIPYNLACYQSVLGDREEALCWLRCAVTVSDVKIIRTLAADDPDLAPLRDEISRLDQL